ncbi:hypothetical protein CYMTET_20432 [Cymbomonas tetramitiformis]|uniref:Uncharacterized protein n=1 Tax=Cymbomonas tetramitiformis TaxID=36881 RepID=A0AAE0L481_9CHLO|nr:hypothetical protein CYMTET_20432 [Cymbomonas tetramitiformis]|eukprot:gene29742-37084_t
MVSKLAPFCAVFAVVFAESRHPVSEENLDDVPTAPCFPWNNVALDGAISDPQNHIPMLENAWTRVVEVTNPGGAKELYHTHARPSLFMQDLPAAVQHWYGDGSADYPDPQLPMPLYHAPMTVASGNVYFMPPNDFHSVKNVDNKLFHSVRMELKGFSTTDAASLGYLGCPNVVCTANAPIDSVSSTSPYKAAAQLSMNKVPKTAHDNSTGVRLVLENEAVRVWDVLVNAGEHSKPFGLQSNVSVVVVDKLAGYEWADASSKVIVRASTTRTTSGKDYYAPANLYSGKVFMLQPGAGKWVITNTDSEKNFHAIIAELIWTI